MALNDRYLRWFLLLSLLAVAIWSFINPHDRFTWWLEAFPVCIGLPILIVSHEKYKLTPLLYVFLFLHAVLLLVGAHYTYEKVPLGDWARDYFHFSRNHYDRLGHFMQGLVPALLARELLLRTSPLRPGKWMFALIVFSCLGISALYELLEWVTAVSQGDAADAFLGTQGDPWDTQEDMATALVGAVMGLLLFSGLQDRFLKNLGFSKV